MSSSQNSIQNPKARPEALPLNDLILYSLLFEHDYFEAVLPYLKKEYFENEESQILFDEVQKFENKYQDRPAISALLVQLEKRKDISQKMFAEVEHLIESLVIFNNSERERVNKEWLLLTTEEWCKDRAFYNAIVEAAAVINKDDEKAKLSKLNIPEKIQEALSINFDAHIGYDYFERGAERFDFYTQKIDRVPFHIDLFNTVTKGGLPLKTLLCFMSNTTGGFKTGTMCDWATYLIQNGYDVLYITLEMSAEMISKRIDANLLNVSLDLIETLPRAVYLKKLSDAKEKCTGRLIVQEYPTTTAHAKHFRYLLKELNTKKNFRPKVVFVDYLNLCASSRMSFNSAGNSYNYVKAIAEELRGLAVEFKFACVTGTQGNRGAIGTTDVSLSDVSESIGLPATCDIFIGIISNEQLDLKKQIMFKQLKNRFGSLDYHKIIVASIDKDKMRLSNLQSQSVSYVDAAHPIEQQKGEEDKFSTFTF